VPELLAQNPLDEAVLLYDGEELVGAKQDRILNVTVLVPAASSVRIPVSCVEEGRWHARSDAFSPAEHHAYPELRRRKAVRLAADPMALGEAQAVVWDEVASRAGARDVHSPTGAQADIFDAHADRLAALRGAFPLVPGQAGALLALGGHRLCLDYVSRPAAFARLYPKLLAGYLLDALDALDSEAADERALERFVGTVATARTSRRSSPGLGDDVRLRGGRVVGSGLDVDGELVQVCAFSAEEDAPRTRIARPSRRV
jgi:hypothetical protein